MSRPAPDHALPGYVRPGRLGGLRRALVVGFLFLSAIYGFLWAIGGTYLLVPMMAIPAFMGLLVIWLLPETGNPPLDLTWKLLVAFTLGLLFWPDYLAISIPGLPWITVVRLIGTPLAICLLVCLSVSAQLRRDLFETLEAMPLVWRLMALFSVLVLLSVAFSADVGGSLNKAVIATVNWFFIFIAAVMLFREPLRIQTFLNLILLVVWYICLLAIWESQLGKLPWVDHIPSFLAVGDPEVERILSPKSRAAAGIYRVQSKFTTPLGLAEVVAMACPLLVHMAITKRALAIRVLAGLALPLSLYAIYLSDSRLGVVGFAIAALLLLFVFGVERWRERRDSLIAPMILISYPVMGLAFIASTFVVGRIRKLFWGGGAQQYSTATREAQYTEGFHKMLEQPWGYGSGQGGLVLNVRDAAGNLSIDTYVVMIGLEYGFLGLIAFFGLFAAAIYYAIRIWLKSRGELGALIAPLAISLITFIVIKLVFSQQENHPLAFIILGALVALVWRVKREQGLK